MPESSRRRKEKRSRHAPGRGRSSEGGGDERPSGGVRPRFRPRTRKKALRWLIYGASVLAAAAVIGGIVASSFAGSGQGGGGGDNTGTGAEVGQRIDPMPLIYRPGNHITRGATFAGAYNSTPPTSGPHWGTGWAGCGISDEELPHEQIVHNMEHGQVIIGYNLTDEAEIERLKDIARSLPGRRSWMILHPYSKINEGEVAVSAWGWLDRFEGVQEERIRLFYDAHRNNSGVESIPCGQSMG